MNMFEILKQLLCSYLSLIVDLEIQTIAKLENYISSGNGTLFIYIFGNVFISETGILSYVQKRADLFFCISYLYATLLRKVFDHSDCLW